ncbi:choloylglycine hydrolase family protein [Mesorhizobium sp. KR2-14]|uniref:choloylglycine hydrolase family protein n=1 Tax=Mesorhizobium sp. KR2-14 TaxID=3156610 RepID=UPI0032B4F53C
MNALIGKAVLLAAVAAAAIIPPAAACTGIMLKTKDGSIVHGRTVEFGTTIESSIAVVPRGYAFVGQTPSGDGLKYSAKHAAVGAIAFKDLKLLDGLNDAGLAVGAFYFPTFAGYTAVTPANQEKALSPADFTNWLLTQFGSVDEAREAVESEAVIIAPTVLQGWGPEPPPFHYVVYDRTGASIVIEPIAGRLVVHDNPLGVMTNSPAFDWHMTNLRNYIALNPRNVPPITIDGKVFQQLGQGSGMLGLPGDFTPPSRFVRAAVFSATAIPSDNAAQGIEQVFHILNNFDIPVGVAREEDGGVMHTDYTMVTTARDPQSLRYYYKTYDDQTIRMVDLTKFDPEGKKIRLLSTRGAQPVVDMTDQVK